MESNPSNRGAVVLGTLWTQGVIATLVVAARFYARLFIEAGAGWDDWTMLVAVGFDLAATATLSRAVHYGLGSHQNTLSITNAEKALELQWIYQPLQVTATTISRVSVAIFIIRLFPTKQLMKRFLIVLTAVNAIVGIVGFTLIFTQCTPSRKLWMTNTPGHCSSPDIQKDIALLKAAISAFSDLVTAAWPIAILWTLHMRLSRKIFLGALFGLTVLAMICTIVQAHYLTQNTVRTDETYASPILSIWSSTSVNAIIIVGSIPSLPPLFRRYRDYSRHSKSSELGENHTSRRTPWSGHRKSYTHPTDDVNTDKYPLQPTKVSTHITAAGNMDLESGRIFGVERMADIERVKEERSGIHLVKEFDVESRPRSPER